MSQPLIQCKNLSKKYLRGLKNRLWYRGQDLWREISGREGADKVLREKEYWALKDISFTLQRGQCLGVVGANGSGKSTLLRICAGLIKPSCGRVTLRGSVGSMSHLGSGFHPYLTGRENIYMHCAMLGFKRWEVNGMFDAIVRFAELEKSIDTQLCVYSSGMRARLAFAIASRITPDVLLVDEIMAVGDVAFKRKCVNRLSEMSKQTATIFVSHAMPMVEKICDQILVLNQGRAIYQGTDIMRGTTTSNKWARKLKPEHADSKCPV